MFRKYKDSKPCNDFVIYFSEHGFKRIETREIPNPNHIKLLQCDEQERIDFFRGKKTGEWEHLILFKPKTPYIPNHTIYYICVETSQDTHKLITTYVRQTGYIPIFKKEKFNHVIK